MPGAAGGGCARQGGAGAGAGRWPGCAHGGDRVPGTGAGAVSWLCTWDRVPVLVLGAGCAPAGDKVLTIATAQGHLSNERPISFS